MALAARLGRGYLELHPEEGDANRLVAEIEAAIAVYGPIEPRDTDPDRITATLQRVVRGDYVRDQVVAVSGWVLSRTEARLYALVSLSEQSASKPGP